MSLPYNPTNPAWLYKGQVVCVEPRLAGIKAKPGWGLRCVVESAHGDHAWVVNEKYNFRRLMSRWDLWLPPPEETKP